MEAIDNFEKSIKFADSWCPTCNSGDQINLENMKILAAKRGVISTVIIPDKNKKDLSEIPEEIQNGLEIIPINTVEEVLNISLERFPSPVIDPVSEDGESSKESGGLPYNFILKFFIFVLGILLFFELLRQILNFIKKNDLYFYTRVFFFFTFFFVGIFFNCWIPSSIDFIWHSYFCCYNWIFC